MLGSLILYLKGMRTMMFQLSGFYHRDLGCLGLRGSRCFGFRNSDMGVSENWG